VATIAGGVAVLHPAVAVSPDAGVLLWIRPKKAVENVPGNGYKK
jgi:hypothetical protein